MSKHTKGPWRLVKYEGHEAEGDFPGRIVGANGDTVFAGPFSFRSLRGETAEQAEANARLMAASPELLGACHGGSEAMSRALPSNLRWYAKLLLDDMLFQRYKMLMVESLRRYADTLDFAITKATEGK